nr:DUF808 domain-containing protein [Chthonobacter albigriseus]
MIALLDDIAGLAKVAAASIDDIAGQAAKAGVKAAGVVIDDAAVTPRYVTGFAAERELPIVGKIALGSLKNKLIFLLPAALALGFFAPWAITPLLMLGGAYLAYEGAEKVYEKIAPHGAHEHEAHLEPVSLTAETLEDQKIAGAIKTDFILSAEIMAITLAAVTEGGFWTKAITLAVVGIGITLAVYGAVALIVKADDAGVALARNGSQSAFGSLSRGLGRSLVKGMPVLLAILGVVGTAAMIWVGGGIIIHGLEEYGFDEIGHFVHDWALAAGHAVPAAEGFVEWVVTAALSGVFGLIVGFILIPIIQYVIAPVWRGVRGLFAKKA